LKGEVDPPCRRFPLEGGEVAPGGARSPPGLPRPIRKGEQGRPRGYQSARVKSHLTFVLILRPQFTSPSDEHSRPTGAWVDGNWRKIVSAVGDVGVPSSGAIGA
jgi:hypothetical protein